MEAARSWSQSSSIPDTPTRESAAPTAILAATEAFLVKWQNRGIQPATLAKYRTLANQLRAYAEARGYVFLDQITVADMDRIYASWNDGILGEGEKTRPAEKLHQLLSQAQVADRRYRRRSSSARRIIYHASKGSV